MSLVLMYHRIGPRGADPWSLAVTADRFARQIDVLRRRTDVVSLRALWERRGAEGDPSRPRVAVTFDDGYADNLVEAAPLLVQAEVPATVFVATGSIGGGREFWWDELEALLLQPGLRPAALELDVLGEPCAWTLGDTACYPLERWMHFCEWRGLDPAPGPRQAIYSAIWTRLHGRPHDEQQVVMNGLASWANHPRRVRPACRMLSIDELETLATTTGIEIGAHTVTHPVLPALPADAQAREIVQSKVFLESRLGRAVTSFAYPHGQFSDTTRQLVSDSGFDIACTTEAAAVTSDTTPLQIPRVQVENWDAAEFERRLDDWRLCPE